MNGARVVHITTVHQALDVRIHHKQCTTLAEAGYDVHLLVNDPPGPARNGVRFHRLHRGRGLRNYLPGLREAARTAARLEADLYHFHDPELIPVGLWLARRGARVVYDVHEDAPVEALTIFKDRPLWGRFKAEAPFRGFEAAARRGLHGFSCATPHIARKFPPDRTVTVHNFPRLEEFPRLAGTPHAKRPPVLLYHGGIFTVRGVFEMLDAVRLLPDAQLRLLGVFQNDAVQARAEAHPGWSRVCFDGWVSRTEVVEATQEARVGLLLFHPERDHVDALPNKLFEYMAAGLPIVASDFPLWRDIIGEAGCGLLVDPLDPAAIAKAASRLLADPREAEAMGRRGRRAVETRYNWSVAARTLLDFYGRILAR